MRRVDPKAYKNRLLEAGVLESGCHRVFVGGDHGQKLHIDRIQRGTALYREGIRAKAEVIHDLTRFTRIRRVIVGIANGTNQEALDLADYLDDRTIGVETIKVSERKVQLTQLAKRVMLAFEPDLVVMSEDASTQGTMCASVVPEIRSLGMENIIAVPTWQRQPILPKLDELGVAYNPVIHEDLPTYNPRQCKIEGFCADNIPLLGYGE
jgi:hypothetical protein